MFAPFLPFTSEKLHSFFGYETPLFGEQYIEEVSNSLGSHKVLRYRDVSRIGAIASPKGTYTGPQRVETWYKVKSARAAVKKLEESVIEEERARLGK